MTLQEAIQLAEQHMKAHGLIDAGWTFEIDTMPARRLGQCDHGTMTISLTKWYVELNSREFIEDTILHEIAHALTRGHGHDRIWKAKCIEIGAKPNRLKSGVIKPEVMPRKTYRVQCTRCDLDVKRYKRPRSKMYCTKCSQETGKDIEVTFTLIN